MPLFKPTVAADRLTAFGLLKLRPALGGGQQMWKRMLVAQSQVSTCSKLPFPALLTTGGGHCSTGRAVGRPTVDGLQEADRSVAQ